jgi:predicted transcriptional regulator
MKTIIGVESFEEMRRRTTERARLLDRGERIEPERRITFESIEEMLSCLTPQRLSLIRVARKRAVSISELAAALARNRTSVQRDVKLLSEAGLVTLTRKTNPGHGQVQIVRAIADCFTVTAQV